MNLLYNYWYYIKYPQIISYIFFTKKGYAQLLQSLPRLQSVGRCDAFGQVLEYLKTYNLDPITLAIKFFHSRDVSYDQLKLMTDMCPDLIHVSLYVDEDAGNLLGMHKYIQISNISNTNI